MSPPTSPAPYPHVLCHLRGVPPPDCVHANTSRFLELLHLKPGHRTLKFRARRCHQAGEGTLLSSHHTMRGPNATKRALPIYIAASLRGGKSLIRRQASLICVPSTQHRASSEQLLSKYLRNWVILIVRAEPPGPSVLPRVLREALFITLAGWELLCHRVNWLFQPGFKTKVN